MAIERFVGNVTWLRKQHGFSKKQMAQILGICIGSLNKIENGQLPSRLGIGILHRIHAHFGISATELIEKDFAALCNKK